MKKQIFPRLLHAYAAAAIIISTSFTTCAQVQTTWKLDNNANNTGVENDDLNGTLVGSPGFFSPGRAGSHGLDLNGTSQYIYINDLEGLLPAGGQARSIGAWAKTTDATGVRTIVAYGTAATGQSMFIGQSGTSLIAGAYGSIMTVPGFWTNNIWHHVALTYDGATAILYADGVQVATLTATWDIVLSLAYIGRNVNGSEYWKGSVDDVHIDGMVWGLSGLLTITKQAEHRVGHWPLDATADNFGNGDPSTAVGDPNYTDASRVGTAAITLNGSTQYIDAGSQPEFSSGTASRSIMAWAKTSTTSGAHTILAYGSAVSNQSMFIGQNGTSLVAGAFGNTFTVSNFWATDVWHHVCLTYNGETAKLYADGVQVASAAKSWSLVLSKVYVGRNVNDSEYWNGSIDEARVYASNLFPPEILTMTSVPAAPTGFSGTAPTNSAVNLSWADNANNERQYQIQRLDFYAPGYNLNIGSDANTTSYTDDFIVSEGMQYSYRICANNSAGNSDFASTSVITPSIAPTDLVAFTTSSTSVDLRWTDNSNTETGYRIERSTAANGSYSVITTVGADVMTYSNTTGLSAGTAYYYRVCAVNGSTYSAYTPVASATTLTTAAQTAMQTALDAWAYEYQYDGRGRVTAKKVPGADWLYMVYDDRDRLVLTQDGNQRAKTPTKEWNFIKYDVYNRAVVSGKYLSNNNLATMQAVVNTYYASLTASQAWFETYIATGTGNVLGYDNKSFPQVSDPAQYLTVTYYDGYDTFIAPSGYSYVSESLTDPETGLTQETNADIAATAARVKGVPTATLVKNMASGTWMRTVNYYDEKYRLVQSISDHQKGKITVSNIVDFTGKVVYSKRTQTHTPTGVNVTLADNPDYDHMARLKSSKLSVNGAAAVTLNKITYNELGQVVEKQLHSTDGTNFKQSVDYRYNIRGWLTQINQADVSTIVSGDAVNDFFGMELSYNTAIPNLASTLTFNGNISAVRWSKGNGGNMVREQAYVFDYDAMNRMVNANHYDYRTWDGSWQSQGKAYSERNLSYDLNGNMLKLVRYDANGYISKMDSLVYSYSGNRLTGVVDLGNIASGFINGATGSSTSDYSYDLNGNLTADNNKGITAIAYNHMNLPQQVNKGSTDYVVYTYDAAGRKLAQQVFGSSPKTTDYIGALIYEGDVLKSIQHSEGRIIPDGVGWEYQYYLKDHLGNVRITFTSKAQTPTTVATNFETTANTDFENYSSQTYDLVDHTDAGTVYQKVQWLNGGTYGRVGLAKSMPVMPGDLVEFSAYCKYMNVSATTNPNALITSLAAAFGVSATSTGEQLKIYNGLAEFAGTVPGGDHPQDEDEVPKAFVTILFFDKDRNFLDAAWKQVTAVGEQSSGSVKQPPHDLVSISARAPEAGFAYVFLSNEDPKYVDVYFDDASLTYTPSPIVGVSDYFPFGMQINAKDRDVTQDQKMLYSSKELLDELSLNWYDFGARMYDPAIGRWGVIDPLTEKSRRWSPYAYAFNSPLRYTDPDGMENKDEVDNEESHRSWITQAAQRWERRRNGTNGVAMAQDKADSYAANANKEDPKKEKPKSKKAVVGPGGYSPGRPYTGRPAPRVTTPRIPVPVATLTFSPTALLFAPLAVLMQGDTKKDEPANGRIVLGVIGEGSDDHPFGHAVIGIDAENTGDVKWYHQNSSNIQASFFSAVSQKDMEDYVEDGMRFFSKNVYSGRIIGAQSIIDEKLGVGASYDLRTNSCVSNVKDVLFGAGYSPSTAIYRPSQLASWFNFLPNDY